MLDVTGVWNLRRACLFAASVLLLSAAPARADVRVEVVGAAPEGYASLARDETYYVRLRYATDTRIRLWARPYSAGKEASAKSNPSPPYEGSGEAIGWFAFSDPVQVDEVRIIAGGGSPYKEWQVASYSVGITCCASRTAARAHPEWVDRLMREAEAAGEREAERVRNQPPTRADRTFDALVPALLLGTLALGLTGLVWPVWGVWKWRGGWRAAAALPAGFSLIIVLGIVIGTAIDPTSHNLWPFELLIGGVISVGAMFLLSLARVIARRT
jgi:hypothetical protein